jgi:hypothetical protein
MIRYLRDVAQLAIAHPVLSIVGAILAGCGLLVVYLAGSVALNSGRELIRKRQQNRRRVEAAFILYLSDISSLFIVVPRIWTRQ